MEEARLPPVTGDGEVAEKLLDRSRVLGCFIFLSMPLCLSISIYAIAYGDFVSSVTRSVHQFSFLLIVHLPFL